VTNWFEIRTVEHIKHLAGENLCIDINTDSGLIKTVRENRFHKFTKI